MLESQLERGTQLSWEAEGRRNLDGSEEGRGICVQNQV